MADKCGKCGSSVAGSDVIIKCVECSFLYHSVCSDVRSSQNLLKEKTWKCKPCKEESASGCSRRNNEVAADGTKSILDTLHDIDSNINTNMNQVRASIDSLQDEFQKLNIKCEALEDVHVKLRDLCDQLAEDNEKLKDDLRNVQERLIDSEQQSNSSNIEILGLPYTYGEDLYYLLWKLAEFLGLFFVIEDVSLVQRVRVFSKKLVHAPVLVQFVSRRVRDAWVLTAKCKGRITATQIMSTLPESKVYVNEELTSHNRNLLGRARWMKQEGKLHFAGFVNGKVIIKPTMTDDYIRVLHFKDLAPYDK